MVDAHRQVRIRGRPNCNTNPHADSHNHTNLDPDSYSYTNVDSDRDCNANVYTNGHGYSHLYTDTNAQHLQLQRQRHQHLRRQRPRHPLHQRHQQRRTPSPVVTTNPATNVASVSATLNGSVNPRGSTTTVYFQWGTTTSYGHTTAMQTKTGNTSLPITANISGLSASHLYHFRIVATNGGGTSFGSDRTFTTLSATGPPVVTTNPATNVTTSSARLNGSLNPHGLTTTVYFKWGTTTSYGHTTPRQTQTGNTYRNITANISGLTTHHTYHFRIVATNSAGTRMGSDRTFNTP